MLRYLIQASGTLFVSIFLNLVVVAEACCDERDQSAISRVVGRWATQGYGAIVVLHACEADSETLCGTLEWLWDAERPAARYLGEQIFWGAVFDGVHWRDGRMRNPEDGREYRGRITRLDDHRLHLRGCALRVLCQEQLWRRLESLPHLSGAPHCRPLADTAGAPIKHMPEELARIGGLLRSI